MRFMDSLDLFKAKRDTSKLVQVQRTVSRNGKVFNQNFWVKPSDVRPSDNVIGGQQNLLPTKGSVPKPPKGTLDSAYFDSIKSDKKLALDYLKECGLKWQEHSHAAINWMRAMQVYTAAGGTSPQSKPKASGQSNTQTQPQTQQSPQNSQAGSPVQTVVLTQTQLDEVNSGKNGKEKSVILKKLLGNDKCVEYAKGLGVTWDENPHPAINIMRMSMALKEHFDTADGTVSPVAPKKDKIAKTSGGKVGAPDGNDNAKKDVKDDSLLEIPAGATERETNIINLINSLTDEDEMNMYKSVGMIAEDDVSKDFISDKLSPKYSLFKAAHMKSKGSSSKTRHNSNTSWGFADQIAHDLGVVGCKKDVVGKGFNALYSGFDMGIFVDPRETLVPSLADKYQRATSNSSMSTVGVLMNLRNLSVYATEEYDNAAGVTDYATSLGYTGWDAERLESQYDLEKEGFTLVVRKIAKDNPGLSIECDSMIAKYDQVMRLVGKNPKMLDKVMSTYYWGSTDGNTVCDLSYFSDRNFYYHDEKRCNQRNAEETLRVVDNNIKSIPAAMAQLGCTEEEIKDTLDTLTRYHWGTQNVKTFQTYNPDRTSKRVLDLTSVVDSSGAPLVTMGKNRWGEEGEVSNETLALAYADHFGDTSSTSSYGYSYKQAKEAYEKCKFLANFSSGDYKKVHELLADMTGLEYIDENTGESVNWDTLDVSSGFKGNLRVEKKSASPELDKVMSNILMVNLNQIVNTTVAQDTSNNARSKINDDGGDYSRNFDFYTPEVIEGNSVSKRQINVGYTSPSLSADELNTKVKTQLESLPNFSEEYIDNVTSFYSAASNFTDAGDAARKANFHSVGIKLEDYKDSPLKDVLSIMSNQIVRNIPTMRETKGKGSETQLEGFINKKLDYVPYNYVTGVQTTLSEQSAPKKPKTKKAVSALKALRQELLKSTNCTISVEDDSSSLQMRKDFMKNWDYDGKTHPKMYSGSNSHAGADRRALFNSRFFKVNNSSFTQAFEEHKAKTGQTPAEHYHATSYASTAGILGVSGGWHIGKAAYVKTAQALGAGAYFGRKGGKSSVYCGEGSGGYHDLYSTGAVGDNANGCYILTSLIEGEPSDSTVCNSFREYEIVVRNNACLNPHHFVDISCRNLGVNVQRDAQGNYVDSNGRVTHDKYGTKIDMK